jgi:hypothetical protein
LFETQVVSINLIAVLVQSGAIQKLSVAVTSFLVQLTSVNCSVFSSKLYLALSIGLEVAVDCDE